MMKECLLNPLQQTRCVRTFHERRVVHVIRRGTKSCGSSAHSELVLQASNRASAFSFHRCNSTSNVAAAFASDTAVVSTEYRFQPTPEEAALVSSLLQMPLDVMMKQAADLRDVGHAHITFSPKVFIPLTLLCRDSCGYCTFAQPPRPGKRSYMTLAEVLAVAKLGAEQGCTEALFTLGDKPELLYPEAAAELSQMGYSSTLQYVQAAAALVLRETGLLPHVNAGVMGEEDVLRLKQVSASQGLMLEGVADSLTQPGGAHFDCPDKLPAARLATIEAAGKAAVPYTSGILIGIGETREERLLGLLALRRLHKTYGHIQELIIQNFRAKKGTAMAHSPEPSLEELCWSIAAARLIFGATVSIQAPPNLTSDSGESPAVLAASWTALIDAGINDWGGISPITKDFVNPEKPWPHLGPLAAATAAAGKALLPRLPVYPPYLSVGSVGHKAQGWLFDAEGGGGIGAAVRRHADSFGLARASSWCPGGVGETEAGSSNDQRGVAGYRSSSSSASHASSVKSASAASGDGLGDKSSSIPQPHRQQHKLWQVSMMEDGLLAGMPRPFPSDIIARILEKVLSTEIPINSSSAWSSSNSHSHSAVSGSAHTDSGPSFLHTQGVNGGGLIQSEILQLLGARGHDFDAVCKAADTVRQRMNGEAASYVVNRNINYTNVCTYKCSFCAFSKGKATEEARGPAYVVPLEEITRRTAEAWERGATEVCMQGGIHPDFTGDTYLAILAAAKKGAPDIHVHAFSPLEVWQGAATLGLPLETYLTRLREAGLGSLPGTAAEVLDDNIRSVLCPDKINTAQWLQVIESAHRVGLRTTSTIMFGAVEGPEEWATHLMKLKEIAARTGGITEFVPLPFVHMEAPLYLKGLSRKGPTLHECILLHAVARLVLHPHITNIQASWVKMGPALLPRLLQAGCNDAGGVLMNESITRAAGASFGQELCPSDMEAWIHKAGREPYQRTTLYGRAASAQTQHSYGAAQLQPTQAGGRTLKLLA